MKHLFTFAYLDPGTGSLVVQSIIGVVAGIGVFGRKAINSVRLLGKGQKPAEKQEETNKD